MKFSPPLLCLLGIVTPALAGTSWHDQANAMQQESIALAKMGHTLLYSNGDAKIRDYELSLSLYEHSHQRQALEHARKVLHAIHVEQDTKVQALRVSMTESDFLQLQAEVHFLQYQSSRDLDFFGIKEKLSYLFNQISQNPIKAQLNKKNKHADEVAFVQRNPALPEEEVKYRQARAPYIKRGLEQFFNQSIDANKVFTTGFVGTGGGFRAMMLTLGYARALEKLGLLDASMYITSLSGSTWFLAPWTTGGKTVKEYKATLCKKVAENFVDITQLSTILCTNPLNLMGDLLLPKFIFGQAISSVDIYGALLALVLFYDSYDMRQEQHLSEQWDRVKDGALPFPIYTSVSMQKSDSNVYSYNWYEFNPLEVRNLDLQAFIPSWAFDSRFKGGKSIEVSPEQSLGYLMGVFGSAYTVNFQDLNRLMINSLVDQGKPTDPMEAIKYKIVKRLLKLAGATPVVGTTRFSPAQINNPFRQDLTNELPVWLTKQNELVFVDAGIDYNIPVRPLLRPERKVNAIIIGESSGNVYTAEELYKFLADAKRVYGYTYEEITPAPSMSMRLFKDQKNSDAPKIIYINYIIDPAIIQQGLKDEKIAQFVQKHHLDTFDAKQCLDEHCNTFNFEYTEEQFLQLAAVGQFNMMMHQDYMRAFLANECLA